MKNKSPLVYIVILNYNGIRDTLECIESIKQIDYENYVIVIVDNMSTDGSINSFENKNNDYIFIQSNQNLGYAGGNNIGIKYAMENNADYVCILNNDVEVDKGFLTELVEYSVNNSNVGIIGPMICEYYNCKIVQSTGANINFWKGEIQILNKSKNLDDIKDKIIQCDYVGGACLLIKSSMIDKIGLIPEDYFLFYEETEWCIRVKRAGYDVMCDCHSKIKHKGSESIRKVSGLSDYYMHRNRVLFQKRNATKLQLTYFFFFLLAQTIYRVLSKKENLNVVKYYYDGLFNRFDGDYLPDIHKLNE